MKAVLNDREGVAHSTGLDLDGFSREQLLGVYRCMLLSRKLDDKEIQLKNQSQIFFQISGAGHEAVLVAAGLMLKPGYDWFFPYYRDRALCLQLGVTPLDMLLAGVGAKDDPTSGGRQMPSHWGHTKFNIVSGSSPTGTQVLQAVGSADASVIYRRVTQIPDREAHAHPDEITYVSLGEGSTSEGEFWEAINVACGRSLPVLFLVEDNGYAISVPVEVQTAGGDISRLVRSFPGLHVDSIDGTDFFASARRDARGDGLRAGAQGAGARPRARHPSRTRTRCPTMSGCTSRRRSAKRKPDAIRSSASPSSCGPASLATDEELAAGRRRRRARGERGGARGPGGGEAGKEHGRALALFAGRRSDARPRSTRRPSPKASPTRWSKRSTARSRTKWRASRASSSSARTSRTPARQTSLPIVKGKGGVFKLTHGLQRLYGDDRVFNSPLAEASIVGRAIGMAARKLKPVVEIQFFDYIWPAMMQIRDELSMMRYRSGNTWSCAGRDPRADRRLPARRRSVSQPVRREHLRALPRHPHRVPVERGRCGGTVTNLDPLRRSGAVSRAQAPVPPDLQQGRVSRRGVHDPVRQGQPEARRRSCPGDYVGRAGPAIAPGGAAGREGPHFASRCSTCGRSCRTTGTRSPRTSSAPTASSSRTRIR